MWNTKSPTRLPSPGFVVMEFERLSRNHPYAYLVLYDPSVDDSDDQQLEATWAGTQYQLDATLVETIGTMRVSPSIVDTDAHGRVQVSLPQALPSPQLETQQPLPAYFAPRGRDAPLLLLAPRRVSWSVLEHNTRFDAQNGGPYQGYDASKQQQASEHTESIEIARPTSLE